MINLLEEPENIYKDLLDKGEDLTTKEVIYLRMKGVDKTVIRKATKLKKMDLETILKNSDSVIQNHKKAVDKMGAITKFNMTKERAEQLKAEGKNKTEIAKISGVSLATYIHHEKKWNGKAESNKVAPLKVKDAAPVRDYAEYTTVINDLKAKLKHSEQVVEGNNKLITEYADKNMRLSADNVQLSAQNEKLVARIEQLEQEKMDLHAAANDTESELMIEAGIWRQQALQYKAENERLNSTLTEVRQDADKHKGDSVLFRSVLKAVL